MKVQVKKAFKGCSLVTKNSKKTHKNKHCMKFSLTPNTSVQQVPKSPISKSMPAFSVAPFFKNVNPHVRISKMVNEHSIH